MKYWSLWCSVSWTRPRWTLVNSCIGYRLPIHHLGQFPLLCHSRTNSFLRWEISTAPSLRQPLLSFPPQKHVRIHQANLPRMVIDLEVMLPQGVWATTHLKMDLPDAPPGKVIATSAASAQFLNCRSLRPWMLHWIACCFSTALGQPLRIP